MALPIYETAPNVKAGKAREAVKGIEKIEGVKSVEACWGRPDLIAQVEAADNV